MGENRVCRGVARPDWLLHNTAVQQQMLVITITQISCITFYHDSYGSMTPHTFNNNSRNNEIVEAKSPKIVGITVASPIHTYMLPVFSVTKPKAPHGVRTLGVVVLLDFLTPSTWSTSSSTHPRLNGGACLRGIHTTPTATSCCACLRRQRADLRGVVIQ